MATRFVNIDRCTPMLLPWDLRDWLPPDPIVHFSLEAVEPVFGFIKEVMGFRRFRLPGRAMVSLEWVWVGLSYNLKRMFVLQHQVVRA